MKVPPPWCRMSDHIELVSGFVQGIELSEELLFGQLLVGEATFGFVVGVNEVFHGVSPW